MSAKKLAAAKTKTAARSSRPARKASQQAEAGDMMVTIDRRRGSRRGEKSEEAAAPASAPTPALERRQKVVRRRQIDPTTCERDYSVEEVDFMNAMDEYKRKSGRMFPTCSEVLEVIRGMGYVKLSTSERTMLGLDQSENVEEKLDAVTDAVDAMMNEAL
jgi:hypothetical protein